MPNLDKYIGFGAPAIFLSHRTKGDLKAEFKEVRSRIEREHSNRIRVWADDKITNNKRCEFWAQVREDFIPSCHCAIIFVSQTMLDEPNGGFCSIEIADLTARRIKDDIRIVPVCGPGITKQMLINHDHLRGTGIGTIDHVDYNENFEEFVNSIINKACIEQLAREYRGEEFNGWARKIGRCLPPEPFEGNNIPLALASLDGECKLDADTETKYRSWTAQHRHVKLAYRLLEVEDTGRLSDAASWISGLLVDATTKTELHNLMKPLWVPDAAASALRSCINEAHGRMGEGSTVSIPMSVSSYEAIFDIICRAYRFGASYKRDYNPLHIGYAPPGSFISGFSDQLLVGARTTVERTIPAPTELAGGAAPADQMRAFRDALRRTRHRSDGRAFVTMSMNGYLSHKTQGTLGQFSGATFLVYPEGSKPYTIDNDAGFLEPPVQFPEDWLQLSNDYWDDIKYYILGGNEYEHTQ